MSGTSPTPEIGRHGLYHEVVDQRLVQLRPHRGPITPVASLVYGQMRGLVLNEGYVCLGGMSALRRGRFRFGLYPPLGTADAARACGDDLRSTADTFPVSAPGLLIAVFDGPVRDTEAGFEDGLWRHLTLLRGLDTARERGTGLQDPGFFFGGREYFAVGMHPAASRWSRRFSVPTLVFNDLSHDALLRARDEYDLMRTRLRDRDTRLQGAVNPMVNAPRIARFSGREVPEGRGCPGPRARGVRVGRSRPGEHTGMTRPRPGAAVRALRRGTQQNERRRS